MAFDAFFLSAVLGSPHPVHRRTGGKSTSPPEHSDRSSALQEGREKLLFAANPAAPRLHLTAASPENPAQPPMFCMLLRKHLLGAKLTEVSQHPMERAASFRFDCTDEMGFPVQKTLVAELMGRTCNLYLSLRGFWTACAQPLTKRQAGSAAGSHVSAAGAGHEAEPAGQCPGG